MNNKDSHEKPGRLREQVEAARQLVEEAEDNYESGRADEGATQTLPDSFPGYEITREIHRGGQGIVYQAIQESPRRDVAIKVMREGLCSGPHDRVRFEREIFLLGQLTHPHIVTIHDSGLTAGHCYFVMDYIEGRSLDVYMADETLSTDDTLQLFVSICHAVSAAHLRGIIHRDIKPSNIRIDKNASPHILDFGLATLAEPETWTVFPAVTVTGQFLGSLPWASPEQAVGTSRDIDLRTDVYSLGVVLYQMLTGRFPYPVVGNMRDVLDNILSAMPDRPSSTRIPIHYDIETIVMKCLNKDPRHRYQSTTELASDIDRYLRNEPIIARPPSITYQLAKFVRRNRTAIAVTTALAITSIVAAASLISESVAKENAFSEQRSNVAADVVAVFSKYMAKADPKLAVSVLDELLHQAEQPASMQPSWLQTLGEEFRSDPLYLAGREEEFARLYESADAYPEAAEMLQSALDHRRQSGERTDLKLRTANLLGDVLRRMGKCTEAETLAIDWFDISLAQFGADHDDTVRFQVNLADALQCQGKLEEAETVYRKAIAVQARFQVDSHPDKADTHARLALCLIEQGRYDEAAVSAEKAFRMHRASQGASDSATLESQYLWSLALLEVGRLDEAKQQLEQVVRLCDTAQMRGSLTNQRANELFDRLQQKYPD